MIGSSQAASVNPAVSRKVLRFVLGVTLATWFSQAFAWNLSFLTPLLAMMILATPMPAPRLKQAVGLVLALLIPMLGGTLLIPFLLHARWAGVLMVALALFYSFYFTARGGSPLLGTIVTVALTLTVTIGSVNADILILLIQGLAINAALAMVFVWLAHQFLPDLPVPDSARKAPPTKVQPSLPEARRNAMRAFCIVFPLALLFLFISASPGYTVVMIKVASMGQQATADKSREMGRSLMASTIWGGLGAIICWNILTIWPSLTLYTLLMALVAMLFGRRIFVDAKSPDEASMWSYALLTLIVILAPAVTDSFMSDGVSFWARILLFVLIAIYGNIAVAVFDAFWRPVRRSHSQPSVILS
jgi:hypothetical protein